MACTMRIAAEHARFGQPEVKLGLLPGGGERSVCRVCGKGRALQLILTGDDSRRKPIALPRQRSRSAASLIDRAGRF